MIAYLASLPSDTRDQVEAVLRHEARIWRSRHTDVDTQLRRHPSLRPGDGTEHFTFDLLDFCAAPALGTFVPLPVRSVRQIVQYRPINEATLIRAADQSAAGEGWDTKVAVTTLAFSSCR
jgi:hypothetical protein